MITVEEAIQHILTAKLDFGTEEVKLLESKSRILAQDLVTDRPLPPYHRVTMDGIALSYSDYDQGTRTFPIEAIAAAGAPQVNKKNSGTCVEVMTGAILPNGTDTVIRYEDLEISDGHAKILIDNLTHWKNIHTQGSDTPEGTTFRLSNSKVDASTISMAASVGQDKLTVKRLPKVALISTGDELVDVDKTPLPHQIRRSNTLALHAILESHASNIDLLHLIDDEDVIKAKLDEVLRHYDLVILSGGVSKGRYDFIPSALKSLQVEEVFHRVRQRPGKPMWFGKKKDTVVFGLPGNPVSSFMCCQKYIISFIKHSLNQPMDKVAMARLEEDFSFRPDLHLFLPVHTRVDERGILWAKPLPGNGSGDFANLLKANSALEIPRGKELFKKGEAYPVLAFNSPYII